MLKTFLQFISILFTQTRKIENETTVVAYINRESHYSYFHSYFEAREKCSMLFLTPYKFKSFPKNGNCVSVSEFINGFTLTKRLFINGFKVEQAIIEEIRCKILKISAREFICAGVVGKPIVLSFLLRKKCETTMLIITDLPYDNKILKCFNNYKPDNIINFGCNVELPRFQNFIVNPFRKNSFVIRKGQCRYIFISQPVLKLRILSLKDIYFQCGYIESLGITQLYIKFHPREPLWERCVKYYIFMWRFKLKVANNVFHECDEIYSYTSSMITELHRNGLSVTRLPIK